MEDVELLIVIHWLAIAYIWADARSLERKLEESEEQREVQALLLIWLGLSTNKAGNYLSAGLYRIPSVHKTDNLYNGVTRYEEARLVLWLLNPEQRRNPAHRKAWVRDSPNVIRFLRDRFHKNNRPPPLDQEALEILELLHRQIRS